MLTPLDSALEYDRDQRDRRSERAREQYTRMIKAVGDWQSRGAVHETGMAGLRVFVAAMTYDAALMGYEYHGPTPEDIFQVCRSAAMEQEQRIKESVKKSSYACVSCGTAIAAADLARCPACAAKYGQAPVRG